MKVLGKKSLSSVICVFLWLLLLVCMAVIISGGVIVILDIDFWLSNNITRSLTILYLSSIPAAILIAEFIGIFRSLKKGEVFLQKNLQRLKISYMMSLIMGTMYMINSILLFVDRNQKIEWVMIYLMLTYIIALVFLIFGIGLVVLAEIYKKAIQYKEENELTI